MPDVDLVEDGSGVIITLPDSPSPTATIGPRSISGDDAPRGGYEVNVDERQQRRPVARRPEDDGLDGFPDGLKKKFKGMYARERAATAENNRLKQLLARRNAAATSNQLSAEETAAKEKHAKAKVDHKNALDNGDTEAATEAAAAMADAAAQLEAVKRMRPAEGEEQQQSRLSPQSQDWVDKNPWFIDPAHAEEHATAVAMHHVLKARGIMPDTPKYFEEMDAELVEKFPHIADLRIGYEEEEDRVEETPRRREGVRDREAPRQPARPQPNNVRGAARNEGRRGPPRISVTEEEVGIARSMQVDPTVWGIHKAFRAGQIDDKQRDAQLRAYKANKAKGG